LMYRPIREKGIYIYIITGIDQHIYIYIYIQEIYYMLRVNTTFFYYKRILCCLSSCIYEVTNYYCRTSKKIRGVGWRSYRCYV
jgi:hypothetical protein